MEGRSQQEFHELSVKSVELLVNVGIIDSVSGRWPDDVQENWADKIEAIKDYLDQQVTEVQEFASSFD